MFLFCSQHQALCDKLLHATLRTCPGENVYFFFSLHFSLLALNALLNGTDGSTLAITHRIAWLISVLLQVQRCQAGAAGLPWLPLRPLILWLVSSCLNWLTWFTALLANCCPQPFSRSIYLFWFRVSSHHQQNLIALEELNNSLGIQTPFLEGELQNLWKCFVVYVCKCVCFRERKVVSVER